MKLYGIVLIESNLDEICMALVAESQKDAISKMKKKIESEYQKKFQEMFKEIDVHIDYELELDEVVVWYNRSLD